MIGLKVHAAPRPADDDRRALPLMNVVFLLLAFFLIAGTLTDATPFPVTPPKAADSTRIEPERTVIHVAADGRIAVASEPIGSDGLERAMNARGLDATTRIRLIADGKANAVQVVTLLQTLRAYGISTVELTTQRP